MKVNMSVFLIDEKQKGRMKNEEEKKKKWTWWGRGDLPFASGHQS
jgi:hypothetical protein